MADENLPAPLPQTLDRAALERVLARAAELQMRNADPGEALTEAQLLELGKEVGLTPEYLRQAIAEERTRIAVPGAEGDARSFFGPSVATASRVVRGTQASVLAQIDDWMQREECLQVRRRYTDRMTWEARRDLVGNIRRGFNLGGRGYVLSRAAEVGATVVAIDETKVLVRVDADLGPARQRSVGLAGTLAGGSIVASGGVVALAAATGGSVLIAGIIAAVWAASGGAGFVATARSQRRAVQRAQLALEQVLDRLEHGDARKPGLLDVLSSAALPRGR